MAQQTILGRLQSIRDNSLELAIQTNIIIIMPFAVRMKAKLLLSNCPNYLISNNLHSPIYPQALKAEQLASTFA